MITFATEDETPCTACEEPVFSMEPGHLPWPIRHCRLFGPQTASEQILLAKSEMHTIYIRHELEKQVC